MSDPRKLTTVVSTKGQVILPVAVRRQRRWPAGTRLLVEEREDGVLLRAAPPFPTAEIDAVFGSLRGAGRALTLEEMEAAIASEARRHARD
jgi:AbrB family looped-hinge helix DNA binding protein